MIWGRYIAISKGAYQLAAMQRTAAGTMRVRFIYLFYFLTWKSSSTSSPRRHSDNLRAVFRHKVKRLFASFAAKLNFSPSPKTFFSRFFSPLNMCVRVRLAQEVCFGTSCKVRASDGPLSGVALKVGITVVMLTKGGRSRQWLTLYWYF